MSLWQVSQIWVGMIDGSPCQTLSSIDWFPYVAQNWTAALPSWFFCAFYDRASQLISCFPNLFIRSRRLFLCCSSIIDDQKTLNWAQARFIYVLLHEKDALHLPKVQVSLYELQRRSIDRIVPAKELNITNSCDMYSTNSVEWSSSICIAFEHFKWCRES